MTNNHSDIELPTLAAEARRLAAHFEIGLPIPEIGRAAVARILRAHGLLPSMETSAICDARLEIMAALRDEANGLTDNDRVYFVQAVDGGPVKIGHTTSLVSRFRTLQASSPVKLRILLELPGGEPLEALLHEAFARWRMHGEWFEPCPELTDVIAHFAIGAGQ